jgi:hypothetical protein
LFKSILTFPDRPSEKTGSPSKPVAKREKRNLGDSSHESTASDKSDRVRFHLHPFIPF